MKNDVFDLEGFNTIFATSNVARMQRLMIDAGKEGYRDGLPYDACPASNLTERSFWMKGWKIMEATDSGIKASTLGIDAEENPYHRGKPELVAAWYEGYKSGEKFNREHRGLVHAYHRC